MYLDIAMPAYSIRRGLAVLSLVAMPLAPALAQDDVTIDTKPVGGNVSALFGQGGNIGVMTGPDGVFLIDDQYAPLTPKIRAAVAELSDQPIRFLLNTHWHFDHTGGNENLGQSGTLIVAHDNVRKRLSTDQFITAFDREVPASPDAALPVVTFGEDVTFHINGDTVHAFHVPHAHTDGDTIIHFQQANVLHMGDTFFNGLYPFIDLSSGGSIDGMIAAVERAMALADADTGIIPGHGPLTDLQGLKAYHAMLTDVRNRVSAMLSAGQSVDAIVAGKPTQPHDDKLGGGFISPDAFARTVAESLMATAKAKRKHTHGHGEHHHDH